MNKRPSAELATMTSNMRIPRIILPIISLSAFPALPSVGNDTAFGGTAASPYPVHTKEIRMASEHITIRSEASSSSWLYTCDFAFENMSSDPVTIMMGMPFFTMGDEESGDFNAVLPTDEQAVAVGKPLVWKFTAAVDGKAVRVTEGKPTINPDLLGSDYKVAYTWPMHFPAGSTRKVRNTYKLAYTSSAGDNFLDYILKTGGLWHNGKIGRSRLTVILDDERYILPVGDKPRDATMAGTITPGGYKVSSKGEQVVIEWDLKNFAPTQDLQVVFRDRELFIMDEVERKSPAEMTRSELRKLRNFPYAAHGYVFKDQSLRDYYATLWYPMANPDFKEADLSERSKELISTVKRLEATK